MPNTRDVIVRRASACSADPGFHEEKQRNHGVVRLAGDCESVLDIGRGVLDTHSLTPSEPGDLATRENEQGLVLRGRGLGTGKSMDDVPLPDRLGRMHRPDPLGRDARIFGRLGKNARSFVMKADQAGELALPLPVMAGQGGCNEGMEATSARPQLARIGDFLDQRVAKRIMASLGPVLDLQEFQRTEPIESRLDIGALLLHADGNQNRMRNLLADNGRDLQEHAVEGRKPIDAFPDDGLQRHRERIVVDDTPEAIVAGMANQQAVLDQGVNDFLRKERVAAGTLGDPVAQLGEIRMRTDHAGNERLHLAVIELRQLQQVKPVAIHPRGLV